MRVKLGKRIYLCTVATYSGNGSTILVLTTSNGVYSVAMGNSKNAKNAHIELLENGYYDFSEFDYSN
jgi:hypothetical protein